jgi:hypothetical protein
MSSVAPRLRREAAEDLLGLAAAVLVGDLAADPAGLVAGHDHQVAPGDGDPGREGAALGAHRLLHDLDHYLLLLAQDLLDLGSLGVLGFAGHGLVTNLTHGQEAGTVGSVVDERRLERRLDLRHHALVDVPPGLGPGVDLVVEVQELAALDDGHPGLFFLEGVDQHDLGHRYSSCSARSAVVSAGGGEGA